MRKWKLTHERTIISGRVYDIGFKNIGGGVWEASLKDPPKIIFVDKGK